MTSKLIASAPTPGQMITELHCWIATYSDGTEGIIGGNIGHGSGMMPMMSSRRATAAMLKPLAKHAQALSLDTKNPVTSIRLATFRLAP